MTKCAICRKAERSWTLQPFGPDDGPTFTLPGSHYRGFAAIACCDGCKATIERGEAVFFSYRREPYILHDGKVTPCPF